MGNYEVKEHRLQLLARVADVEVGRCSCRSWDIWSHRNQFEVEKGLLQQGHYALNTSGIDVSTTAQEILQAGDEDVLQKQMTELIKRYTYMSCFEYIASTRTKQLTTFLITETGAKSSKPTYPAPTGTGSLPFTSSRLRPSSSRTSITELLRSSIPAVWQSSMNMT